MNPYDDEKEWPRNALVGKISELEGKLGILEREIPNMLKRVERSEDSSSRLITVLDRVSRLAEIATTSAKGPTGIDRLLADQQAAQVAQMRMQR